MIPPVPESTSADKLKEKIKPYGWQHLGGPFHWAEFIGDIQDSGPLYDEYGQYLLVEPYGKIGQMVTHFHKHRQFPSKSYLFAGQKGIGKTALIKLASLTNLAEDHENVGHVQANGEKVTYLHHKTKEPFQVNPVEEGSKNFDMIQRAMNNPGDTSNQVIESHNAGMMRKKHVNSVAESVNKPLALYGGRRVIILNEFDNVDSRQVPALKGALDPGGGIPDGLLILADTNHIDKVEKSMGDAGMDRFEDINFQSWSLDSLERYAEKYVDVFGIDFDHSTFPDTETFTATAVTRLAQYAHGSIRGLIGAVQACAAFDRTITEQDLNEILTDAAFDKEDNSSQLMFIFKNRVMSGKTSPSSFANQAAKKDVKISTFANELADWLLTHHTTEVSGDSSGVSQKALADLRAAAVDHQGQPIRELKWASCIHPIKKIQESIKNGR